MVDHIITFVSLVIFLFGFEGGIRVLIAPVPGQCILVAFTTPTHLTICGIYLVFEV